MVHFSLFSSRSLLFFALYSCRPIAAATLAASPVKRGNPFDRLECPGPLPDLLPWIVFGQTLDLLEVCGIKGGRAENLGCKCDFKLLICGSSQLPSTWRLLDHCFSHCTCGPGTKISRTRTTQEIRFASDALLYDPQPLRMPYIVPGSHPTSTHTCSKTCTSITRDCDPFFNGECKCYAPPAGLFFWHRGNCGPVHTRTHSPKRDLSQHRHDYYLNATDPAGSPPDLAAQLASGLLPSPCNISYVSFACSDSLDGIVHEPPQNWLGALLPEGAEELLPPVPEEFLRIRRLEAELQVAMVDVK